MKKIYEKNPLAFALMWISIYCAVQSTGNILSDKIKVYESANAVLSLVQTVFMICWLNKYDLMKVFGLNKPIQSCKKMLFYLPLILICTNNLWNGWTMNLTPVALAFHIVLMVCVGFLEELIFRGFLFEAMAKDGMKSAILVSSITFGLGHVFNLFNGRGMNFTEVMVQSTMAIAFGFLFVMVYLRSGSLIPCMIAHAAINISSAFANKETMPMHIQLVHYAILLVLILAYLLILSKTAPTDAKRRERKQ